MICIQKAGFMCFHILVGRTGRLLTDRLKENRFIPVGHYNRLMDNIINRLFKLGRFHLSVLYASLFDDWKAQEQVKFAYTSWVKRTCSGIKRLNILDFFFCTSCSGKPLFSFNFFCWGRCNCWSIYSHSHHSHQVSIIFWSSSSGRYFFGLARKEDRYDLIYTQLGSRQSYNFLL